MIFGLYLISLYALLTFYLALMNLKRARDEGTLTKPALYVCYPILFIGLAIDLLCNVLITLPFLDLPRETTVTYRLKRYRYGPDGWRKTFADWFARNFLDPFDPSGKHV